MAMKLEKVVPFGRTFDEYIQMFNLRNTDLSKNILGVGDGPASFNTEARKKGYKVISVDPLYQFSKEEILDRFNQVVDNIINQVKATPDDWVWSYHNSPDDLRSSRVKAINLFTEDYDRGKQEGRYQIGELPKLNFPDFQYDIALCSHFLFLYSQHYNYQFHLDSIQEMLRISPEVRIFPLVTLMLERSPYLDEIIQHFSNKGYQVSVTKVQYQLQKGGNEMLVISRA
ncbi:MAG: SAM-dependent methyltransferase [Cyanobacteria bacterium P01_A01_bin.84]